MLETRNFTLAALELRDDRKAGGLAAPFNSNSHDLGGFVERIAPGAFARSLQEAAAGDINIYALWAHDQSQPLGSTRSGKLTLVETDAGLAFDLDTARMTDAQRSALEDGDLQMSFGFRVRDQKWTQPEAGLVERTLLDVDLSEVSFVVNPAYPATDAALRSLEAWKSEQVVVPAIIDTTEMLKRSLRVRVNNRLI